MIDSRWRSLPSFRRLRRAPRSVAVGAAMAAAHLALLLILSRSANPPLPEAEPPSPPRAYAVVNLETPRPLAPVRRRKPKAAPAPTSTPAPRRPLPVPAPTPVAAAPAPPTPVRPDYGRWTVAPGGAPAQGAVSGLAACTPLTLASLSGAAREACAKRLSEQAGSAPAFAPTPDKRKAKELEAWEAYNKAVADWKASRSMGPHPCPPQDTPAGKVFLDKCSLVNAARRVTDPRGDHPAVKVEFKVKF